MGGTNMSVYPKAPTARIVKSASAERISADAVATLTEAVDNYCASVGAKAIDLATHAGRKTVSKADIELALKL